MAPQAIHEPDQELTGVHIFRAGSYTLTRPDGTKEKADYTDADVAQMAENANKLLELKLHEAPAKLGHDDDQAFAKMAGLPSIGWARRVVAKGKDLFADFSQVPATVAEAIRRGRYRHVSSEIYGPEQTKQNFGDAVKGFTLRAVAFLGADVPVVKGMNPLMLHEGAFCLSEGSQITLEVTKMAEEKTGAAMVNLNRHAFGSKVKKKGSDAMLEVHAQHPDNSYDAHDVKTGEVHKSIPHDDLTLLSEKFIKEEAMSQEAIAKAEKATADANAALLAERTEKQALLDKITDGKISAFAEKHKATLKQPPVLAAFKALAKAAAAAPVVKLAEGEKPNLEAFLAFAESLMAAKPVLFGEVAPVPREESVTKNAVVKMAEEVYVNTDANPAGNKAVHADIAVAARQLFAEKKFPTYRECLLSLTPSRMGRYQRGVGRYAEIETQEVA